MSVPWKPEEDGVTHVNLYSNGLTPAGRFMSNFTPVHDLLLDGYAFGSIEAYWYWLGIKPKDRTSRRALELMPLSGFPAKQLGKELTDLSTHHEPDFIPKIKAAIRVKMQSRRARELLLSTGSLPLAHYYVFKRKHAPTTAPPAVIDAGHAWLPKFYEELRTEFAGGRAASDAPDLTYVFPPDSAFEPMEWPEPLCP